MGGEGGRWLLCFSRGERYGLELRWVRHIDFHPRVLPLPTAEPPLVGLMYWRGSQVPVLSLDQLLGRSEADAGQSALMLEVEGRPLGLLVEGVGETASIGEGDLFALDRTVSGREGLVTEAARAGDELIFRLNADRLPLSGDGAVR